MCIHHGGRRGDPHFDVLFYPVDVFSKERTESNCEFDGISNDRQKDRHMQANEGTNEEYVQESNEITTLCEVPV